MTPRLMSRDDAADLVMAWCPFFFAFLILPFAIYLPNQAEFSHDLMYVAPFVAAAVISIVILKPMLLLRPSVRTPLVMILFYIGVYLVLSDIVVPVEVGTLDQGPRNVVPQVSHFRNAEEVLLAVAVVVFAVKVPRESVKKVAVPFLLMLFIVQATYIAGSLYQTHRTSAGPSHISSRTHAIARGGNVYQVCFDALSSLVFLDAVKELGKESEFDGFTFYKNNRSNYIATNVSVPSYLSGRLFRGGDFKEWDNRTVESSLSTVLEEAGYKVSMYFPDNNFYFDWAFAQSLTGRDLLKKSNRSPLTFHHYDFADLWLLRIAPAFLEPFVYRDRKGLFRRLLHSPVRKKSLETCPATRSLDPVSCVPLLGTMLGDENSRRSHGQFVYLHTLVTHGPWGVRSPECRYLPKGDGTYFYHALCAVRLMGAITKKLKEMGRYHNSTIIFQSDHGAEKAVAKDEGPFPDAVKAKISEVTGLSTSYVQPRTHAFLAIKPAGESGTPMRVSDLPTQLADIPATVYDILGLPCRTDDGRSVLGLKESEEREIHIFPTGFLVRPSGAAGAILELKSSKASICHISYTSGKGWKLY